MTSALVALMCACGGGAGARADSGLVGIVVAGPQCPAEVIGRPCPPKPVSATVTVLEPSGRTVATFTSDTGGHFRVRLAPGSYQLVTRQAHQPQLLHTVPVTVARGRQTQVRLFLDTGIR